MDIAGIQTTLLDYPSPSDFAVIVFMRGCSLSCDGCHNHELKIKKNRTHTVKELADAIRLKARSNRTRKIVLSGGDPLSTDNFINTQQLIDELGIYYYVTVYTGQEQTSVSALTGFTFIKCGPYLKEFGVESIKTSDFMQLSSTNQTMYDGNWNLISDAGRIEFN